jgi:hypothetical protein
MVLLVKRYLLLVFILGVIFTGCTGVQHELPVIPVDNTPIRIVSSPSIQADVTATQQSTDLPIITPTLILSDLQATTTLQNTLSQGKELAESVCIVCHSFDRISNSHKSQAEWELTVKRMVDHGAPINDEQQLAVIEYLSQKYK